MNFDKARFNMIEQQIRPWEVLDETVLSLLNQIPRERFVTAENRNLAYADLRIPLTGGQFMMYPKVEAKLLQALAVRPTDHVLEIGTGSGYVTALLAKLAKHVVSVDIRPEMIETARQRLQDEGIKNVELAVGDGATKFKPEQQFDVVCIGGSLPIFPDGYQTQLRLNGRMFVVVGEPPIMEALLVRRLGESAFSQEVLFETEMEPLDNAPQRQKFVF